MGSIAVVQWERRRLSAMIAEGRGSSLQVEQVFVIDWPEGVDPLAAPAQAAEFLRGRWPASERSMERVVVGLSREEVILRHFDVPEIPDEELPDVVRLQAASRSTVPLDQLVLDFLPLAKSPGETGRPVLVATASKSAVNAIRSVLQGAGVEPTSFTFSSMGLAECVCHSEQEQRQAASRAVLAIHADPGRIEMAVVADRQLLFAHAARLPHEEPGAPATLAAEASRTIVAAQRLRAHLKIDKAYLSGTSGDQPELFGPLSERLGVPVTKLEPSRLSAVEGAEGAQASPALVGLGLAETARLTPAFDFLHPRQPPAVVNVRKLRILAGSAAALVVAALTMGGVEWTRSRLQAEMLELQQQASDLELKIKPGQAVLQASGLVEQWQQGNVNQLQQLSSLERLMEGTERLYLEQYTFTARPGESPASLLALGHAKSREDVLQFQQRLIDTKAYRIQPRQLTQTGRDEEYPNRFELSADLLTQPAEKGSGP